MADSQAKIAWNKAHTTQVIMKLNNNTDAAILAKLASVPSKQGYIKDLIKADIANDSYMKQKILEGLREPDSECLSEDKVQW